MNNTVLAHGNEVSFSTFGTDWLYLGVPVMVLLAVVSWLVATGRSQGEHGFVGTAFVRAGSSLERVTGLPAWSSGAIAMGLWALLVAVIGFLWDVAWHMDKGRDQFLFTPSHMMILIGLASIAAAAMISIIMATLSKADTGLSLGRLRIPYGAMPLLALGLGSLAGFPLDELWHRNYGVDVTMWGPTHLVMISGASFTPIALWAIRAEAGREAGVPWVRKVLKHFFAGSLLVGLSTFQAEFDFGTPQFQHLYHPVLIAAAAGLALTAARVAIGPGGALLSVAGFIGIRSALALLLGPVLNHTVARFPLYIGAALVVEAVLWFGREWQPWKQGVLAGALVGTVGVGVEWGWTHVWGRAPWGANLFPGVIIVVMVGVAAAVLGIAMGRALSYRGAGIGAIPLAIAGLAAVVGLALPLPRNEAPYEATLTTTDAGNGTVELDVAVDPPSAASNPDWFEVLSWQGGSVVNTPLIETGPGSYRAAEPVPASGDWKTLVRIADKDVMVAVPVFMPRDPEIGASEIPVEPTRTDAFVRDTKLLMREAHAGAAWPALVAYTAILVLAIGWIVAFVIALSKLGARNDRNIRRSPKKVEASGTPVRA